MKPSDRMRASRRERALLAKHREFHRLLLETSTLVVHPGDLELGREILEQLKIPSPKILTDARLAPGCMYALCTKDESISDYPRIFPKDGST